MEKNSIPQTFQKCSSSIRLKINAKKQERKNIQKEEKLIAIPCKTSTIKIGPKNAFISNLITTEKSKVSKFEEEEPNKKEFKLINEGNQEEQKEMNSKIMEIMESLKKYLIFYGKDSKSILEELTCANNNFQEEIEIDSLQSIMGRIPYLIPQKSFLLLINYISRKVTLFSQSKKIKIKLFISSLVKLVGTYNPLSIDTNHWVQLEEFLTLNQNQTKVDILVAYRGRKEIQLNYFFDLLCEKCTPEKVFSQKEASRIKFCETLDFIKLPIKATIGCSIFLMDKRNLKEVDINYFLEKVKRFNFEKNILNRLGFNFLFKLRFFFGLNDFNMNQALSLLKNINYKSEESKSGNNLDEEINLEFFFDLFKFKFGIDVSIEDIQNLQEVLGNEKGIIISKFVQLLSEIHSNFLNKTKDNLDSEFNTTNYQYFEYKIKTIENSTKNEQGNKLFIKDDAGKLYINFNYQFLEGINNSRLFYNDLISKSLELEKYFINSFIDEMLTIVFPKVGPLENFKDSQFYLLYKFIYDFETSLQRINQFTNAIKFREFFKDHYSFFRVIIFSVFERIIDESKIKDFISDLFNIKAKYQFQNIYWNDLIKMMKSINDSSFPKKFYFYLFFFVQYFEECFVNVLIDICNYNILQIKFNNPNIVEFIKSEIQQNFHKYILNHQYKENVLLLIITLISLTFRINIYLNIPSQEGVRKIYKNYNPTQKEKDEYQLQNGFIIFSAKLNYSEFFYYQFDLSFCYIYPCIFENIDRRDTSYEKIIYKLIKANFKRQNEVQRNAIEDKKKHSIKSRVVAGYHLYSSTTLPKDESSNKHSDCEQLNVN